MIRLQIFMRKNDLPRLQTSHSKIEIDFPNRSSTWTIMIMFRFRQCFCCVAMINDSVSHLLLAPPMNEPDHASSKLRRHRLPQYDTYQTKFCITVRHPSTRHGSYRNKPGIKIPNSADTIPTNAPYPRSAKLRIASSRVC